MKGGYLLTVNHFHPMLDRCEVVRPRHLPDQFSAQVAARAALAGMIERDIPDVRLRAELLEQIDEQLSAWEGQQIELSTVDDRGMHSWAAGLWPLAQVIQR